MDKLLKASIFLSLLISLLASASAQNCSDYKFANKNIFTECNTLPLLNSFLHWNYHPGNHTVDLAYRQTGVSTSQWVCWALNLKGRKMVGSQCLVAYHNSSGLVEAYTSSVDSYDTQMQPGPLSFDVPKLAAEYSNNEMIIYATIRLPSGQTSFSQVWQNGPVSGDSLNEHSTRGANMKSKGTVDFVTGQTAVGGGGSVDQKKNIHGILNAVSWGIMMPLGAIMARYLRVFKVTTPAWFYLHVVCQTSAYIVGVAGWATGLQLGDESGGDDQSTHRTIGITLFCLGTLQVFALLLRPKPDHKYRFYWNIYHHGIGYTVIVLSIINIFEGFELLGSEDNWKKIYTGLLIILGAVAILSEIITWIIVLRRKRAVSSNKYPQAGNGMNGYNGYGDSGYGSSSQHGA